MWRAINNETIQMIGYWGMIAAQLLCGLLILWAGGRMVKSARKLRSSLQARKVQAMPVWA